MFVYDGDDAPPTSTPPNTSRPSSCGPSARPPRRARRSASTPGSGPRAARARSPGRSAGTRVLRAVGADVGVPGADQGALRRRRRRARRAVLGARREPFVYRDPVPRGVATRDPPHEGAHRARAHPARRGPAVPPQARAAARCPTSSSRCSSEQLAHGARNPSRAATPSTLSRARRAGRVRRARAPRTRRALREAYVLCERARNYRYLLTGRPATRCRPTATRPRSWRGCSATPTARNRRCATTTAASPDARVRVVERVFYGARSERS